MLNLIGVIIAAVLLITLIYRRVSLIPASLLALLVLAVTNALSYNDIVMNHYSVSLGNFIIKYFLMFVTNALFGKIMEETLLAASFSKMIGKLLGEKNAVYGALLATALLSYGGLSVFVIVFTVYPIFLATFRKANLPRKFIPACILSSSCTFPLSMLPGGAQLNNIIPTMYIGTTPMAASLVGLAGSAFAILFIFFYFRSVFAKAVKNGEGFDADPEILKRIEGFDKDAGVPMWLSAVPLLCIILLINVFRLDLSYAVLAASAVAMLIGRKNLPSKLKTINAGVQTVGPAMITTAASVGFGGAVLACRGAEIILEGIAKLPVNPIVSLSIAAGFAGAISGNGGGGADVAMNILSGQYLAMGVNPEIMHRVAAIATAGFSLLPHNGMMITIMDTCGFTAKQCYRYIFVSTVLCSFISLVICNLLGCRLYPIG